MRKITACFLLFTLTLICSAQNSELDSLKLVLQSTKNAEDKYELNAKISKIHFKNSELDVAEGYLYENIKIANQLQSQEKLGTAYQSLVLIFIRKPDEKKLLEYNKKAYDLFTKIKDQKGIAKSLLHYSIHYQNKSNYTLQAKYGFKSLEISKKITHVLMIKYIMFQLKTNPHPLDKYRCNVPLSRSEIFRSLFNVKKGDGMWWHNTDTVW